MPLFSRLYPSFGYLRKIFPPRGLKYSLLWYQPEIIFFIAGTNCCFEAERWQDITVDIPSSCSVSAARCCPLMGWVPIIQIAKRSVSGKIINWLFKNKNDLVQIYCSQNVCSPVACIRWGFKQMILTFISGNSDIIVWICSYCWLATIYPASATLSVARN